MASQSIGFRPQSIIQHIPWGVDKKAALRALIILVTFSLIGWLYLGQASIITSSTLRVNELRREIELQTQRNNELILEIAQTESIARTEERAYQLGFAPTDPSQIRYLVLDSPIPLKKPEPTFEASALPQSDEGFWQTWSRSFQAWVAGTPIN